MGLVRNSALALGSAYLAIGSAAHAQSNAAIAEQLFLDGQKLMSAGSVPEACAKFADSERLDPAIGTLMHLAACHEKMGRFASAWSEFSEVVAQAHKAGQTEREKYAREHAAAIEGKLPKVVIDLPNPPQGTTVTLDGSALPLSLLGTEMPLDPGDHSLQILAPGMKPWRQPKVSVGANAVVTRLQVTLEQEAAQQPAVPSNPAEGGAAPPLAPEHVPASGNVGKRILGYSLGGLGVVSLVVTAAEAVTSAGRSSDENKYPAGSSERQTVADQASAAQTYAIVFGAAGVAAIGAGLYFVLTARDSSSPAARLGVTPMVGRALGGATVHLDW